MMQPSLLAALERADRPRKRVRQTSRAAYAERRAVDEARRDAGRETREGQVLRLLAWHWNERQVSPTALELLAWAKEKGESLFDANSVRPRLHALVVAVLVESGGKRVCRVSGKKAHVWRVCQR